MVVYDNLVNEELLAYAPAGARVIYAGKEGGNHTLTQDKINELLVREALDGCTVARLRAAIPLSSAAAARKRKRCRPRH